ncbi:MAG: tRNA (adenosine(37)-N6)-dimethylallyltransferase MiaA [Acidobacteriia bacterium]|nr:tRNA (adenosine(37)-N6)-dimethylallyltransferase MiaA [Terriglobia bacterium]
MSSAHPPVPYPLVAVLGPTASGKSALATVIALRFHGEIINYDSIQVFKYFDIGSAKPSRDEQTRVPHHLLDLLEPNETFTAGEFARRARSVLEDLRRRGRLPVLAGGTGLYLRALLEGLFEGPQRDEALRTRLRDRARLRGSPYLHRILSRWDPDAAARIAPQDSHRLIRALELYLSSNTTQTEFFSKPRQALQGFSPIKIGLNPPRKELYTCINRRVGEMFNSGLITETQDVLARGVDPGSKPLQSLGYSQVVQYLRGQLSRKEALEGAQQATRRYAKRQWTWYRKETGVVWFNGLGSDRVIQQDVLNFLEFNSGVKELTSGGCCG